MNKNPETKICSICGEEKSITKFEVCRSRISHEKIWRSKACRKCRQKRYRNGSDYKKKRCEKMRLYREQPGIRGQIIRKMKIYNKHKTNSRKAETFNKYGGCECCWCGESDLNVLTMDHVNNDGAEHRRQMVEAKGWKGKPGNLFNGSNLYIWLKRNNYPPGFQVLCMNCNWAKHVTVAFFLKIAVVLLFKFSRLQSTR